MAQHEKEQHEKETSATRRPGAGYPEKGYLYVVRGPGKYFDEAAHSIQTLRRCDPEAHVTLVTDESFAEREGSRELACDRCIVLESEEEKDEWKRGLLFKTLGMYKCSPYEKTFFVDSDTHFVESCRPLFDLLNYHDVCIAHAPNDDSEVQAGGKRLSGYTPYNTGILLFRKAIHTAALFKEWNRVWKETVGTHPHDQPALMKALLASSCSVYVLRNNWNARFTYPEMYSGKVKLLHGRHKNLSRVARRVNVTTKSRLWVPQGEACIYRGMDALEAARAFVSVFKFYVNADRTRERLGEFFTHAKEYVRSALSGGRRSFRGRKENGK